MDPLRLCYEEIAVWVSDQAVSVRGFRRFEYPEEVAAEIDVLPSERGDMTNEMIRNGIAAPEAGAHWEFEGNVVMSLLKAGRKRGTLRDSEPRTRYLSSSDERKLLANCDESLEFAVAFAIDTGLRREEQFGLRWNDIDMNSGVLEVSAERTKTRKTRLVPLLPRSAQMLAHQRQGKFGESFVFSKPDGSRYPHRRRAFDTAIKTLQSDLARPKDDMWLPLATGFGNDNGPSARLARSQQRGCDRAPLCVSVYR